MSSDTVPEQVSEAEGRLILDLLPADDPVSVKLPRQATVLVESVKADDVVFADLAKGNGARIAGSTDGPSGLWLPWNSGPASAGLPELSVANAGAADAVQTAEIASGAGSQESAEADTAQPAPHSQGAVDVAAQPPVDFTGSIHAKAELPAAVVHQLDGRSSTSTTLDQVHAPIENQAGPDRDSGPASAARSNACADAARAHPS